jgi:hypothetical protein
MKMIEEAIRTILIADEKVRELADERIYHIRAVQNSQSPFIVITRLSTERPRTMEGLANYARGTVVVEAFADDIFALKELTRVLIDTLDQTSGNIDGLNIDHLELQNERYQYTRHDEGREHGLFNAELQFAYMTH